MASNFFSSGPGLKEEVSTYAYMLHQLVNLVALWLVIVHYAYQSGSPFSGFKGLLEGDDDSDVNADVKKMP